MHTDATTGDRSYTFDETANQTLAEVTQDAINQLHDGYAPLDKTLRQELAPAHIFITDYPNNATDQTGHVCTASEGPFPRFQETTWAWLEQTGVSLNDAVNQTASFGWVPITGIAG